MVDWGGGGGGGNCFVRGLLPFMFENMWLKKEGFKTLIDEWWRSFEIRGIGRYVLIEKLKALKGQLRTWNKNSFGESRRAKEGGFGWREGERKLEALHRERERELKLEALQEFKCWALMEGVSWRQKSREIWLKEGDKNALFFHRIANSHRRGNHITKMKINEVWVKEEDEMKQGIMEAFKSLLSDTGGWRANLDGLNFQRINEAEAERLETLFTVDKVFIALRSFNGDKTLGSDAFTLAFWQFRWDTSKDDILRMFKEFFENGKFVKNLNTTFLVLVSKKGGAEDF